MVKNEAKKLINQVDKEGSTPLHLLIKRWTLEKTADDTSKGFKLLHKIGKDTMSYFIFGKP